MMCAIVHWSKDLLEDNLWVQGSHFYEGEAVGLPAAVVARAFKCGIPVVTGDKSVRIVTRPSAVRVVRNSKLFFDLFELRGVDRALIADLHARSNAA